jgi:hypothetical protein
MASEQIAVSKWDHPHVEGAFFKSATWSDDKKLNQINKLEQAI